MSGQPANRMARAEKDIVMSFPFQIIVIGMWYFPHIDKEEWIYLSARWSDTLVSTGVRFSTFGRVLGTEEVFLIYIVILWRSDNVAVVLCSQRSSQGCLSQIRAHQLYPMWTTCSVGEFEFANGKFVAGFTYRYWDGDEDDVMAKYNFPLERLPIFSLQRQLV